MARQLGFGQLPIGLYFIDKLRAMESLNAALEFDRVRILATDFPSITLIELLYDTFSSRLFCQWWSEWKKHLFYQASTYFSQKFDADYFEG